MLFVDQTAELAPMNDLPAILVRFCAKGALGRNDYTPNEGEGDQGYVERVCWLIRESFSFIAIFFYLAF